MKSLTVLLMCTLNKNRERRKELKREREGKREIGVCGCSFGGPLKQ